MKKSNNLLIIRQLDKKLQDLQSLFKTPVPQNGWVNLIRQTLAMSMRQLGNRLHITPQAVKDIEKREKEGSITLNALKGVGEAFGLKLVYAFIPINESLETMIERKANERAQMIVKRTSTTMKLEDQENTQDRIEQAIAEMTEQIKRELPKNLWD